MRKSIIVIILFFLFIINVPSVNGAYVVTPYSPPAGPYDAAGAYEKITFFELPLWIQICWIVGSLLAFFGAIKFGSLIIGRIKDLLKNKNRSIVFNYINSHPGCTIADLSKNMCINRGTVKYHIYLLQLEKKIIRKKDGNKIYLFRNGGSFLDKKQVFGYIRNPTKQRILFTILREPGISNSAIANRLHNDKSSIYRHLCQFLDEHMVECHWNGKNMCYTVTPETGKILNEISFSDADEGHRSDI
jgi:predicted transcriptional regulator